MKLKRSVYPLLFTCCLVLFSYSAAAAGDQPRAIFHAFDQKYGEIKGFVCQLRDQGYSHIQIPPAQKSNPALDWWARYQPVDYSIIEGRGSEQELKDLIATAHGCHIKVIADVVFNHMADMPEYEHLNFFPNLSTRRVSFRIARSITRMAIVTQR